MDNKIKEPLGVDLANKKKCLGSLCLGMSELLLGEKSSVLDHRYVTCAMICYFLSSIK